MGAIIDAIAWAKSTLFVVIGTEKGSPQRRAKLDELARATVKARELADAYQGDLAIELRFALRMAEMGLDRFRIRPPGASPGRGPVDQRADGRTPHKPSSTPRRRRVHPRRLARTTS